MRLILLILNLSLAGQATAQHSHAEGGHATVGPQEVGQSAFAALAEIVTILREDPETDWSAVDIAGLRRHLIDMDLVTTEAEVAFVPRPKGARFEVRGQRRVLQAIRAMVSAHAPFLAGETVWEVSTANLDDGIALIVDGDAEQIQGLGFIGMMTIGAHHKDHHLMIARGISAHK